MGGTICPIDLRRFRVLNLARERPIKRVDSEDIEHYRVFAATVGELMLLSDYADGEAGAAAPSRLESLLALERFWYAKRQGPRLPSKSDFPPTEMKPWLGHLMLVDVARAPLRFRVRLMGVSLVNFAGKDHTGKWFDEIFESERLARNLHPYLACLESKAPRYDDSAFIQDQTRRLRLQRLHLPCAEDGETVDLIIGCGYASKESSTI